jgi:hypothetical protein
MRFFLHPFFLSLIVTASVPVAFFRFQPSVASPGRRLIVVEMGARPDDRWRERLAARGPCPHPIARVLGDGQVATVDGMQLRPPGPLDPYWPQPALLRDRTRRYVAKRHERPVRRLHTIVIPACCATRGSSSTAYSSSNPRRGRPDDESSPTRPPNPTCVTIGGLCSGGGSDSIRQVCSPAQADSGDGGARAQRPECITFPRRLSASETSRRQPLAGVNVQRRETRLPSRLSRARTD